MQVTTITRNVDFTGDPLKVFEHLAGDTKETVLFESPIGAGRRAERSFLFVRSALRFKARGRAVTVTPLNDNGVRALALLTPVLEELAEVETLNRGIEARYPERLATGSDRDRIKAPSAADALRTVARWRQPDGTALPIQMPGIFAYDFLEQIEALPPAKQDTLGFADYVFWLPEVVVSINHKDRRAQVACHCFGENEKAVRAADQEASDIAKRLETLVEDDLIRPGVNPPMVSRPPSPADEVSVDLDDEAYAEVVRVVKEHIVAGDVFQIVPSRTFSTPLADPMAAYRELRRLNPSPYLFYVNGDDFTLFGASPEAFVRVHGYPATVEIHPIAGTRPRGRFPDGTVDADLDNRLEADLRLDKKELAEHMMLVDLARNDVARISEKGTRRVRRLSEVERYSHVMHLVSVIEGQLEAELDAMHAYLASMNMGTLVGAPKIEAACLLRKYEADKRGTYGGAVGFLTSQGELETAIIIRSAVVKDGVARVRAGAGVVYDSDPIAEAVETSNKAGAVLKAIELAKEGGR